MWSRTWEGEIDAVKDGSGLVRKRFVVRRDDDSCLRATLEGGDKIQGRRKGSWVADLAGTRIEFISLAVSCRPESRWLLNT